MFRSIGQGISSRLSNAAHEAGAAFGSAAARALARPKNITLTGHPTWHARHALALLKQPGLKQLPWQLFQEARREFARTQQDPHRPPTALEEAECMILCLRNIVEYHLAEYASDPQAFAHLQSFYSWILRDHDGTKLPKGALLMVKAMEIAAMCSVFQEALPETDDENIRRAKALLATTESLAAELLALQTSGLSDDEVRAQSARLIELINLDAVEAELAGLMPEGALAATFEKFGLKAVIGELRVNSAHLRTEKDGVEVPTEKLLDLMRAMKEADAIYGAGRVIIAACAGRGDVEFLLAQLKAMGLSHVKVVPLLESQATVEAFLAGEYDGLPIDTVMKAGSDSVRTYGPFLSRIYILAWMLKNWEDGRSSYLGTGVGPERNGGGNSDRARELFLSGRLGDKAGLAPDQMTKQGGAAVGFFANQEGFRRFADSLVTPADAPMFFPTRAEIAGLKKLFSPFITADLTDRLRGSRFFVAWLNSLLPRLAVPFAGSRDAVTKESNAAPAADKGPFEDRTIKVYTKLLLTCTHGGMALADVDHALLDAFVAEARDKLENGSDTEKLEIRCMLSNMAMQFAHTVHRQEVEAIWRACGFSDEDIEALGQSLSRRHAVLEATGLSMETNPQTLQLVAEDYGVPFNPQDLPGTLQAVREQTRQRLVETLKFLTAPADAPHPYVQVEAAGTLRRSYSTLREVAEPLANTAPLRGAVSQAQLDSLPVSMRAALRQAEEQTQRVTLPPSLLTKLPRSVRDAIEQ